MRRHEAGVMARHSRRLTLRGLVGAASLLPFSARAQEVLLPGAGSAMQPTDVAQLALFAGTVLGGGFFAYRLAQERRQLADECTALRARIGDMAADNARLTTLADARDRRIVMWPSGEDREAPPVLFGDLPAETGAPQDRATFLGFGRWLRSHSAGLLEHAIADLRGDGTPFDLTVETAAGKTLEVEGRAGAQGCFIRFLPAHASRRTEIELRARAGRLQAELDRVEALRAELVHPAWTRDRDGRLDGVNRAYAVTRGHETIEAALSVSDELFGEVARNTIAEALDDDGTFSGRLTTTLEGERRVFHVQEVRTPVGSAGVAVDITEADDAERTLTRTRRAHAEALNNLATAVAGFDADAKLVRWNAAFERMWQLDRSFLESAPSNAALLDTLRAEGQLPESPRWREWVQETLEVYRASEPREFEWTPPDGRTIHVVAAPQEGGGVMWLFENMTEQHALASRANELMRLRDASIEHLEEGIAVFGADGRLRLANPAFAELWDLDEAEREIGTHVRSVAAACADRFETPSTLWIDLAEEITGHSEERAPSQGQVRLAGDRTLAWTSQPLPRGETLTSFIDMSDTVRVADALKARNEAMERADRLKSAFLGHVSYELRSPLTSIIGFTDLLVAGAAGAVTERQSEYIGYIGNSSKELMRTVDQIIDLSAIDAGEMRLERGEVRVDDLVARIVDQIEPRLEDHDLVLEVEGMEDDLGTIEADGERLAQVVNHLLLNAIEHTEDGGTLTLALAREDEGEDDGEMLRIEVRDTGDGIPEGMADRVFEPFVQSEDGGRRKAGLGLATVKAFVELHGGRVELDTGPEGTTIACLVPVADRGEGPTPERRPVLRAEPVSERLPSGERDAVPAGGDVVARRRVGA